MWQIFAEHHKRHAFGTSVCRGNTARVWRWSKSLSTSPTEINESRYVRVGCYVGYSGADYSGLLCMRRHSLFGSLIANGWYRRRSYNYSRGRGTWRARHDVYSCTTIILFSLRSPVNVIYRSIEISDALEHFCLFVCLYWRYRFSHRWACSS